MTRSMLPIALLVLFADTGISQPMFVISKIKPPTRERWQGSETQQQQRRNDGHQTIDDLVRQGAPARNMFPACVVSIRNWVGDNYRFAATFASVGKTTVTMYDIHGQRIKMKKSDLSPTDQKWIIDMQRHFRAIRSPIRWEARPRRRRGR